MGNDPVNLVDPDGGGAWDPIGKFLKGLFSGGGGLMTTGSGQLSHTPGSSGSGGGGFNVTGFVASFFASLAGNAVGGALFPLPKPDGKSLQNQYVLNSGSSVWNPMKTTTDAGHGDKNSKNPSLFDPGAYGMDNNTQYEKDYALMIEEATDVWLTAFGIDNTRTRTGDKDARPGYILQWREDIANNSNSEVFISFHLDQAGDTKNLKVIYQQGKPNEEVSKYLGNLILSGLENNGGYDKYVLTDVPSLDRKDKNGKLETHLGVIQGF